MKRYLIIPVIISIVILLYYLTRSKSLQTSLSHKNTLYKERARVNWKYSKFLNMYAFSAFYDDRPNLNGKSCIRIVSLAKKKKVEKSPPYCLIVFENGESKSVISKPADIGIGVMYNGSWYREYVFECPVKDNRKPVKIYLADNLNRTTFWPIPVEFPISPAKKEDFAVCVICAFSKFPTSRILEFVEMHHLLGVSKVFVYDNNLEESTLKIFKMLSDIGKVDLTNFKTGFFQTPNNPSSAYYSQASPAINDCILRNMYAYKKLIIIDLDEIIIPTNHMNYSSLLRDLNKKFGKTGQLQSYHFRNAYFFSDFESKELATKEKLVTLRKFRAPVSDPGYSIKSIIDPLSCYGMHNHYCWHKLPGSQSIDVPTDYATMHHYKKCHFEGPKCKQLLQTPIPDESALKFKDQLMININKTASAMGLKNVLLL